MANRFLCVSLAFLMTLGQAASARQSCEKLKDVKVPKVEITSAALVRAGSFASSVPTVAGTATVVLAAHCEVKAVAQRDENAAHFCGCLW